MTLINRTDIYKLEIFEFVFALDGDPENESVPNIHRIKVEVRDGKLYNFYRIGMNTHQSLSDDIWEQMKEEIKANLQQGS